MREATQHDEEAIGEVHAEAWRVAHRDLFETRWLRRRRIHLWTITGANRARIFHESFGFTKTGKTREHDFGDGRPVLEVEYLRSTG